MSSNFKWMLRLCFDTDSIKLESAFIRRIDILFHSKNDEAAV